VVRGLDPGAVRLGDPEALARLLRLRLGLVDALHESRDGSAHGRRPPLAGYPAPLDVAPVAHGALEGRPPVACAVEQLEQVSDVAHAPIVVSPVMRPAFAVLLAFAAATLYALSTSLQAMEARATPRSAALRATLLARLVRRPRWLAGTAAGALAWPVQAVALALGSVALVQPALGFGLVVLLALGGAMLGEQVGRREVAGVVGVVAAVAVLGWAAPAETGSYTHAGVWVVAIGLVALAPLPVVLRRTGRLGGLATSVAAGIGWAWVAFATSLVDESLADRRWLWALVWAVGVGAASWGTLLAEMTSLQVWPATRAIPIAFGLEMLVPAAVSPGLTRVVPPHPVAFGLALALAGAAAALLGGSRAVAKAAVPLTEP
jgi:hypothetical protein